MVKAIFIDALNTLFVPRDGKTRYDVMQQIIFECTGVKVALPDLMRVHAEKKEKSWRTFPQKIMPHNLGLCIFRMKTGLLQEK